MLLAKAKELAFYIVIIGKAVIAPGGI
jgi:hypothetical protein